MADSIVKELTGPLLSLRDKMGRDDSEVTAWC